MPIRPPALDDRSFDDLVTDLVRRIPAHTPDWTNPREGEAGGRAVTPERHDGCLWIAMLAGTPDAVQVAAVREELGGGSSNRRRAINVGIAPAITMPEAFDDIGIRARIKHVWEVATGGDG